MKHLPFILLLFSVGLTPAHAKMYKWVDANGKVHYSDREPPPQDTRSGTSVLNGQGMVKEQKQGVLTPAQRQAREAAIERERQLKEAQEQQKRKDKALLTGFSSPQQIDARLARDLAQINSQISNGQAEIIKQQKRMATLQAQLQKASHPQQKNRIAKEILNCKTLIATQKTDIARQQANADALKKQSAADKKRLIELLQQQ